MKESKVAEGQITHALKEYEGGKDVVTLCRELGINRVTFTANVFEQYRLN